MGKTILITGASSGIGAELARQHAAPDVHLILSGRSVERLAEVKVQAEALGAHVTQKAIDVTDRDAMATWLTALDAAHPIDLVYANAGYGDGVRRLPYEPEEVIRGQMDANFFGVMNTIYPLLPGMTARGRGQISVISSLAGYGPMPSTAGYSASKAAVRVWGDAMRMQLARVGVGLTVVCPGFIRTPMTKENPFPMPFLMNLDRATRIIIRGTRRNLRRVAFPWPLAFIAWTLHAIHPSWSERLLRRTLPKVRER